MRLFRIIFRSLFSPRKQSGYSNRRQDKARYESQSGVPWSIGVEKTQSNLCRVKTLSGKCYVIDGDTIVIRETRIRLAGIDAPELDQPWGKSAKFAMIGLCRGKVITAEVLEGESYDRVVAKCFLPDGTDLSAALVKQGLALDWAKFSGGAYRHLEPEGIRKKLWRVTAKHQGRMNFPSS
ncbi:thermonuclease family protein [Hoeflea sp. AS60]|uniref:thermonuclease family protein n=1 Tax=Hoeflea sp. AS60 TaxID=3135780 RepID=UPI00317E88C0